MRELKLRDNKMKANVVLLLKDNADEVIGVRVLFDEPREMHEFLNKRRFAQGSIVTAPTSGNIAQPRRSVSLPPGGRLVSSVLATPREPQIVVGRGPQKKPCKNC